ncbi:MAG: 1-acyl-sn-glycerol-3-phosphate acyltransferase [Bacteroidota bacterium]
MGTIRAVLRIVLTILVTAVLVPLWALGSLFTIGNERRFVRWRGWVMVRWARALAVVMGMRIRTEGTPPARPFCLVANHLSYVDVLLLLSQVPCTFISKAEVNNWPGMGWLARTFGTLFIDRSMRRDILRITAMMEDAMDRGEGIVFFPEGTSHKGDYVRPFKPSLLDLPARTGRPVSYAALSYHTAPGVPAASESICWWGDMAFGPHAWQFLTLPRFEGRLIFGNETITNDNRKELARLLHDHIEACFVPSTQLPPHTELA